MSTERLVRRSVPDGPRIKGLHRAVGVVEVPFFLEELAEGGNLIGRHLDRVLKHEPLDLFAAGRGGQRSLKAEERAILRQQSFVVVDQVSKQCS